MKKRERLSWDGGRGWLAFGILLALILFPMAACDWFRGGEVSEPLVVSPDGGTFTFDNGITIVVPPGAVREETSIQMKRVDERDAASILEQGSIPLRPLIFFEALPDGLQFDAPIEVVISLSDVDEIDGWPIPLLIDLENETYTYAPTTLDYDPAEQEIRFFVDHFSAFGAGTTPDDDFPNECENPATACRCGWIRVEYSHHDFSNDDCQAVSQEIKVQFMDCPGQPTETDQTSEITEGCQWKGSLDMQAVIRFPEGELHMDCDPPVPFAVLDTGEITGEGSMTCIIDDTIQVTDPGGGGSMEVIFDLEITLSIPLSGELDGFNLNFDPLEGQGGSGHLRIAGQAPGVGLVEIINAQFGDTSVSGDVFSFQGVSLLTFTASTTGESENPYAEPLTFPLQDGATFVITVEDEGAVGISTVTMRLSVEEP